MAWFDRKKTPPPQPAEPTPEEKAAAERAALSVKLEHALRTERCFQVMSVDGVKWLDPYTGEQVQAPFDYVEPARDYLLEKRPWLGGKQPHALHELLLLRWMLYLRERIEFEVALRTFASDGRWLNPFNAQWVPLTNRGKSIDAAVIQELAQVLMRCPEAQHGKLLSSERLQEVVRAETNSHKVRPSNIGQEPNRGTVRISGNRASQTDLPAVPTGASIDEDLDKAERVLGKMLSALPAIEGFGFTVHYEPHAQVGGDFYECQQIAPGRFFLALADVSGHGVQGALVVVAALKSLRYALKQQTDLVAILAQLNDEVKADLVSGQFITMFAMMLDAPSRTVQCVCAGHHPALLIAQGRPEVVQRVGSGGAALGLLRSEMFRRTLKPQVVELRPGDTLLMYTDGLSEVHDFQQKEYGDYRVIASALNAIDQPYDMVVREVVRAARQYASGVMHDDVTVISLSLEQPSETSAPASSSG
jgi:hypothetical protein